MDPLAAYSKTIKRYAVRRPKISRKMITTGLALDHYRQTHIPGRKTPESLQYLSAICDNYLLQALNQPEQSGWVNIFAPAEIFHAMEIYPLFIEGFAGFLTSFKCEDFFIDYAEKCGLTETLCSYHKAFIGAAKSGVVPRPRFAVTTSMACDGNINTFRYLSGIYGIPCYIIDIPYEYSLEGEAYVAGQLREMVKLVQEATGRELDEEKLKAVIKRENESRRLIRKYLISLATKAFPKSMAMDMLMYFTSHVFMGTEETLNFYQMLSRDIETCPDSEALRIFWVHLMPFFHPVLKQYFNINPVYQVLGNDFIFGCLDEIDDEHPFAALAKKMITNIYNGPYERKINTILDLLDILRPDAVINFCHWGCKQSSGGAALLHEALRKREIPFLGLDGDGVDRRNSHDGQIRTRLEAFLEIVRQQRRSR